MTEGIDLAFNEAMDFVYSSFMRKKYLVEGRLDSEIRDPQIILSLAQALDLIPPPEHTIRITGSKGKGTTTRMIAKLLLEEKIGKIGTIVSPEEFDHNDRFLINGNAPNKETFLSLINRLRPLLETKEQTLSGDAYLSPFGILLLAGLLYFKEQNVDYYVLEGGRGAQFDEVGNIPAKVAVVTSILFEHPGNLGPTIEDIACSKLFAGQFAEHLVCPDHVAIWNEKLDVIPANKVVICPHSVPEPSMPAWFQHDSITARKAVTTFLQRDLTSSCDLSLCSVAFGTRTLNGKTYTYDACINLDSIDTKYLENVVKKNPGMLFLLSLPDDKDTARIFAYLDTLSAPYKEIILTGTRGYLHYDQAKARGKHVAEIMYNDTNALRSVINEQTDCKSLYFMGTQTYIRLVKLMLAAA